MSAPAAPGNAFTIDVEDYYQVEGFAGVIARDRWGSFESRVEANTRRILDMLDERGIRATFFVLGCVAREHPAIVPAIRAAGHEVASHGLTHRLVYTQSPEVFRRACVPNDGQHVREREHVPALDVRTCCMVGLAVA